MFRSASILVTKNGNAHDSIVGDGELPTVGLVASDVSWNEARVEEGPGTLVSISTAEDVLASTFEFSTRLLALDELP